MNTTVDPAIWEEMKKPIENDDYSDIAEIQRSDKNFLEAQRAILGIPMSENEELPLYSPEVGVLEDLSAASFIVWDGKSIRNEDEARYELLLNFWFECRRKAALRLFTHPGRFGFDGITSHEGDEEIGCHPSFADYAHAAIAIFNNHRMDMKLRLVKLHKVNTFWRSGEVFYMTFDAVDQYSGCTSTYQAALHSITTYERFPVLGLFRDYTNDRTLAIMVLSGAEKDLAVREAAARGVTHVEPARSRAKGKSKDKGKSLERHHYY